MRDSVEAVDVGSLKVGGSTYLRSLLIVPGSHHRDLCIVSLVLLLGRSHLGTPTLLRICGKVLL